MAKSAQQVTDKWVRNLSAAGQDIQAGVQAVRDNPAQAAIAKQAKMRQNILAAIDSGKWAAGLQNVTLQQWQNAMIQKGLPRIATGAQAAQTKFSQFMTKLLTYQEGLSGEIDAMPDLTLQDNINRMVAWTQGMSQFKK